MDDQIKEGLKKTLYLAETRLAKSLLRWKYRQEGRPPAPEHRLAHESRRIAGHAHDVLMHRGKNALRELRNVYVRARAGKEDSPAPEGKRDGR